MDAVLYGKATLFEFRVITANFSGVQMFRIFTVFCSGLLTGKFKRDSKPDESESRIGFVTSKEKLANQAMPSLNNYTNDENFWNLMSIMERIANNHGIGKFFRE